ncbi:MAG TPA: amino acid ABC transporter permease [Solirubrobacteraceae bacterium]|nr:amino acid ABC transporter permease [Solirubrobacteraceae bacterium]
MRRRRAIAVSSLSTVVVLGGLAAFVLTSPGWPSVRRTFLSSSNFGHSIGHVAAGFWLDVRMFLVVEVVVLAAGLVIALIRVLDLPALFPLKILAVVFVDVMRGVPTILVVYLIGFGLPALQLTGVPTSAVVLGGLALSLCYSAYVSEVFRAGIESVHPSQGSAALALGLTRGQALRHVIVPQAVRRVVPPLLNDFISLQKDVALVSIIGPQEAFRVAQIFSDANFNYTPLIAAALLYLCVTIPLTRFVDHLQIRSLRERGGLLALGPH